MEINIFEYLKSKMVFSLNKKNVNKIMITIMMVFLESIKLLDTMKR